MRFFICATSCKDVEHPKIVIDNDGAGNSFETVEIDTLEELIQLREDIGKEIILTGDNTLEVYDGFRE